MLQTDKRPVWLSGTLALPISLVLAFPFISAVFFNFCVQVFLGYPIISQSSGVKECSINACVHCPTSPTHSFFLILLQLNKLEEAANAAHTFFMANPEHMEIQQDIENYKTTAGKVDLIDREARQHMVSLS